MFRQNINEFVHFQYYDTTVHALPLSIIVEQTFAGMTSKKTSNL